MDTLNNRFKNIIDSYKEIAKIARDNNMSFITAMFYYDNRKYINTGEAKSLFESSLIEKSFYNRIHKYKYLSDTAKQLRIPLSLLRSYLKDNNFDISGPISYEKLMTIMENASIVNIHRSLQDKYGTDLSKKLGEPNNYLSSITNYSRVYNLPLDISKKIIDFKIKKYAKKNNVSIDIATIMATYGLNEETANNILELQECFSVVDPNDKLSICRKGRTYIFNNMNKFNMEDINGIKFASKTKEGLDTLLSIFNNAIKNGKKQYVEELLTRGNKEELLITDFAIHNGSCCDYENGVIYLDKSDTERYDLDGQTMVFYHESSHFLDMGSKRGNVWFSLTNNDVLDIYNNMYNYVDDKFLSKFYKSNIIPDLIKEKVLDFLKKYDFSLKAKKYDVLLHSPDKLADKYINDEHFQKKWREEIEKEKSNYSDEDKESFFRQRVLYEKDKYMGLIDYFSDIYDAFSKGFLQLPNFGRYSGFSGHGKKYFSDPYARLVEFIAEIGTIYNSNGEDVLTYEFGPDLAKEAIDMYNNMLSYHPYIIPQVRSFEDSYYDKSIVSFLNYPKVSDEQLDIDMLDNKNGFEVDEELIDEYLDSNNDDKEVDDGKSDELDEMLIDEYINSSNNEMNQVNKKDI